MPKLTTDNAMEFLAAVAFTLTPLHQKMVNIIFADTAFEKAPAAATHHHNYLGGLALHTAEVVQWCMTITGTKFYWHFDGDKSLLQYEGELDIEALLIAAMLHDYCKTLEYKYETELVIKPGQVDLGDQWEPLLESVIKEGSIKKTPYMYTMGHIVGSTMVFQMNAMQQGLPLQFVLDVMHIMLSHQGRHEWNSATEPRTAEAFVLHAADMLSAQPLPV